MQSSTHPIFPDSPVPLYSQLADLLRQRVMRGMWGPGTKVPSLEAMVAEFKVARVTVRQRGVLLDDVSVAPGPFVLNDLFPTGYGGDLNVTITEADGRTREFIVPFAANANLLRPGHSRYS